MTRSTLRSVKLLTELPACSKKAQNSIEKNMSTSTTNSRSRSTLLLLNAWKTSHAKAAPPNTVSSMPASATETPGEAARVASPESGWAGLRRGDPAAGLRHFRASLQREPGEPSPQRGLVEALRARNPLYRAFIRVALRLFWISPLLKWVAIAVAVSAVAYAFALDLPRPVVLALQAAIIAAAVFTWTARPLADLLMLADPAGRAYLDPTQKVAAAGVPVLLAAGLALGLAWAVGAPRGTGMAAIFALFFTIPLAAGPRTPPGRWRLVLAGYTLLLAAPATLAVLHHSLRTDHASTWFGLAIGGLCMTDVIAELAPRPRR